MVFILSKLDPISRKELFVGNYESREKALEVIEKQAKLQVTPTSYEYTMVTYSSGEYRIREMGNASPPAPTTTKYSVASQSDYNKTYTVEVDDASGKALSCSCPDHEHRKSFCKHMRQVKLFGTRGLMIVATPKVIPPVSSKAFENDATSVVPRKQTEMPPHHHTVMVQSESSWMKTYQVGVDYTGYPVNCTCPSFEHRRETCKHMRKVAQQHFQGQNRVRL